MLVMRQPQFDAQDDFGTGSGIPPIPEWQLDFSATDESLWHPDEDICDVHTRNVFMRLRNVFHQANRTPLAPTRLHDLASYVIHRLLSASPDPRAFQPSLYSSCIRHALVLYMFVIQGPTYYTHAVILQDIVAQYILHLEQLESTFRVYEALDVWLCAVGLVAATGTQEYQWFSSRAATIATSLALTGWEEVFANLQSILWLDIPHGELMFRPHWDELFSMAGWAELEDQG